MSQRPMAPSTSAFVLSGGASLGAVQVGMLRALYERGIFPDLVVGTSVGALNGAYIAGRSATLATIEGLEALWVNMRRADVFPIGVRRGLFGFLGRRPALLSHHGLRRIIGENLRFRRLQDARVPLHVIATDVLTGIETPLLRGDATTAVLASAAIPGLFPPVRWKGKHLVDGGVSNDTPISHAIAAGAKRVYVLPTGNACALQTPPTGVVEMLLHSLSLLMMRRLEFEIDRCAQRAELIVMPPPCPLSVRPIDFNHGQELVDRAYEDGRRYLEALEDGRATAPIRLHMHGH